MPGIEASDAQLLANPYLLFERDRRSRRSDRVRGGGPWALPGRGGPARVPGAGSQAASRTRPIPGACARWSPTCWRRRRRRGTRVLPRSWVIRRARERALQPPCPLGENVLDASEESFAPVVERVATRAGEPAYQMDRLVECREHHPPRGRGRKKGKPHAADA